jgi:hypothetical protein
MRQRLNQVVMKKGSDLAELFETLSSIEDWYGGVGTLEEIDLIAIVLDVATEEYHAILTSEQSHKGNSLTLSDLENVMCQHYRQLSQNKIGKHNERAKCYLPCSTKYAIIVAKKGIWQTNDRKKRLKR